MGSTAIAQDFLGSQQGTLLAQDSDSTSQSESSEDTPDQQQASPIVQSLQTRLASLGYYGGPIDGIYGPGTQKALADFQRAAGLAGSGVLDSVTQEQLNDPDAPMAFSAEDEESSADSDSPESAEDSEDAAALEGDASALEAPDSAAILTAPDGTVPAGETESTPPAESEDSEAGINLLGEGQETVPNLAQGAEAPAPSTEQRANRGLFRLAIIGLAIVVLGGLGGGVLLLARRGTSTLESTEEESNSAKMAPHEEKPIPLTGAIQNGSTQLIAPKPSSSANLNRSALATQASSTPRLAKVNIIDELIQDLDNPDSGIRRKSVWELGQRGNSAAIQPLIGLMVDADSHEQSLILAALAEIGIRTLKPMNRALALSLQDENPEVRKNAIRDLTRIYDSMGQVGRILGHAANDDDPEVRQTANWALDQLNHMRLSATEPAGLLQEGNTSIESLPGEGASSHTVSS
ncbi:MAG: HEAT repeat domain-containing protein [Leptolyngbya sp. SIO1E4]|nr:HEAT repeat domain-containing protein [Leptolyngbya sp. SIO1E4]